MVNMVCESEVQIAAPAVQVTDRGKRTSSVKFPTAEADVHIFQSFLSLAVKEAQCATMVQKECNSVVGVGRGRMQLQSTKTPMRIENVEGRMGTITAAAASPSVCRRSKRKGEVFVLWPQRRLKMPASGVNHQRRKHAPMRDGATDGKQAPSPTQLRMRAEVERRSKQHGDRPSGSTVRPQGRARDASPALKKKKVALSDSRVQSPSSHDEDSSVADGTDGTEDESRESEYNGIGSDHAHRVRVARSRAMKKPVTLDVNGLPWGSMKECLADDIKKYAKSLDLSANWESQPSALRSQLFKRLYKDWDMLGQCYRLSEKWVGPIVTKVLITTCWRLNTLIDGAQSKPADVTQEQWNTLVRRCSTEDSQVMSEHMRSISQGKGSKVAQLKAIERDAIVKLTLLHGRKPYQTEITDEVAREYTRQQLEKRKSCLQKGADMDDVRSRVIEMEDTVSRLEEKMGDSQARMENMLKAFVMSAAPRPEVIPDNPTSAAVATKLPHQRGRVNEQNMASVPATGDFSNLSAGDAFAATAPGVELGDSGGPSRTEVPSSDGQVEEFLNFYYENKTTSLVCRKV